MSSRSSITSTVVVAVLFLAGLAAAAEAGRLAERGSGQTSADKLNPPNPVGPVWIRVGTDNVLSEFGPFHFATITDLAGGDGLSIYVVEGSPTIAGDGPSTRFGYFDELDRVWRFDYQGITGEGAFVSIAGFSVASRPAPAAAEK